MVDSRPDARRRGPPPAGLRGPFPAGSPTQEHAAGDGGRAGKDGAARPVPLPKQAVSRFMSDPSQSKGEVHQLWPTPVLTRRYEHHERINPALLDLFYRHRAEHQRGKPGSYASDDNLLEVYEGEQCMSELAGFIAESVFELANTVNRDFWRDIGKVRVDLTGVWFQITNNYAFHETHVHGNCSWSGVYYVQAGSAGQKSRESGQPNGITRFYGPNLEFMAGGHGDFGNLYLQASTWDSYPRDGGLVVFPAHLKHMAFPYQGEQDRVIVSFHAQVNSSEGRLYRYDFS